MLERGFEYLSAAFRALAERARAVDADRYAAHVAIRSFGRAQIESSSKSNAPADNPPPVHAGRHPACCCAPCA